MKVLVTGATGFIGSELVKRLRKQRHDVVSLVRYTAGGRYDYYGRGDVVMADLRDRETLDARVREVDPQVVFHLAAQSAVAYSFQNPVDVHCTNLLGTIALAEAARKCPALRLFVHASTSEVYGRATVFPTPEDHPLGATSPYAVSKIAAEEYLRVLMGMGALPVTIVRPFNSYGRALVGNSHFVVERAITQALQGGKVHLHNPEPRRDFMFRDDHVAGYGLIMNAVDEGRDLAGETINLTTGLSYRIDEMTMAVAEAVRRLMGKEVICHFHREPDRPLDISRLEGDATRAWEVLGWVPEDSLETGIAKAVEEWASVLNVSG